MTLIANGIDAWRSLGGRFSGEYRPWQWGDTLVPTLLLVGFLLGVWGLLRLAKWYARLSSSDHPRSPFNALVRAHGLSRSERATCKRVAAELGFADPAELFVRPETARMALAKLDGALAERLFC